MRVLYDKVNTNLTDMSNTKNQQPDSFENVQETLNRTEIFIEDNKKIISYVVIAIVAIVAIYFAVQHFVIAPKNDRASADMFVAEQYFQKDSFNLALNGDGNYLGFIDIIDDYGVTKTANLAHYYAGLCYLYLGEYEDAIKQLKKFSSDDVTLGSIALGAIGDSYVELGENLKGASYYKKAANNVDNKFTSPMYLSKAAQVYEKEGEYKQALEMYKRIKADYAESQEARSADKNIAKMNAELAK